MKPVLDEHDRQVYEEVIGDPYAFAPNLNVKHPVNQKFVQSNRVLQRSITVQGQFGKDVKDAEVFYEQIEQPEYEFSRERVAVEPSLN